MLRMLGACCLLVLAAPRAAEAEWQLTPFVGLTFRGDTSILDLELGSDKVHRQFGGAVGLLGDGVLGVETIFSWTPGFFQHNDGGFYEKSRTVAWMGNLVLTTPRRWTEYSLRPFVSGGFGWLHPYQLEKESVLPVDLNLAGYNIGGGAVGFLSNRTGLRFDLRYYSTIRPTDEGPVSIDRVRLRYMTASVGIVFRR